MTNQSSVCGGVFFVGLLTIVFIVLKLTGVIGWSWWWVLAPMWVPCAVAAVLMVFLVGNVMYEKNVDNIEVIINAANSF